jgi:uroporphyrinogen-III synthase
MNTSLPVVVVTRPAPDHEALCRTLSGRGFAVIHSPAVARVAEDDETCRLRLKSLRGCRSVIVISPYAARRVVACSGAALLHDVGFLTPGAGTGRILERAGLRVDWPESGGTSEDLLAGPWLRDVSGRCVGIVGAPGGRRLLDDELARRGARVERIDVYRRVGLDPSRELLAALASDRAMIVLVSSTGAFEALDQGVDEALRARWRSARFVVSSERVAESCRRVGAFDVVRADGASDAAMLAALERDLER